MNIYAYLQTHMHAFDYNDICISEKAIYTYTHACTYLPYIWMFTCIVFAAYLTDLSDAAAVLEKWDHNFGNS